MANIPADNLPVPQNLPDKPIIEPEVIPKDEWEVMGYSEEAKVSILKKGKVLKVSEYQPQRANNQLKDSIKELDNALHRNRLKNGLPETPAKNEIH